MNTPRVRHYFDYKSPYAWLAQVANEQLELEFGADGLARRAGALAGPRTAR